MVEDRITDGKRIAQLLSSELHGRTDGALAALSVVDADREIDPGEDGSLAYRVERDGESFAAVFVHPDRVRVELESGLDAAVEMAEAVGIRVRPKAVEPPRTILFVESGAEVKRAADVLAAAADSA